MNSTVWIRVPVSSEVFRRECGLANLGYILGGSIGFLLAILEQMKQHV